MSEISENCYCASWLIGLEYTLWSILTRAPEDTYPVQWGQEDINLTEAADLKRLSEECGGWIVWDNEVSNPGAGFPLSGNRWVPMDTWLMMFERASRDSPACPWCGGEVITERLEDRYWHGCRDCRKSWP
jgi:hypothetical protein